MDAELFRLDAVIRWLDAADGRIKRAGPDQKTDQKTDQRTGTKAAMPRLRRGTRASQ